MAVLDWLQQLLGQEQDQGAPMALQNRQGGFDPYTPQKPPDALELLYEMSGGKDLGQAYNAYQRGEYLPAFGQGAYGAAQTAAMALPALRAGGAAARAGAPLAREAATALPGLLADEAGALRFKPAAPAIIRPGEGALDYRGINMAERPDVAQFPLERPSYGPRANTEKWTALDTPETWTRYQAAARAGLPEGQSGGREWYNTLPLLRAFQEINPSGGAADFRRFIDYVGASSPGNAVPSNIRTASYLYHADKQGLDLPELYRDAGSGRLSIYPDDARSLLFPKNAAGLELPSNLSKSEIKALKDQFGLPSGYGGFTQTDWIEHANNLRQGGAFDLATNPKPPSFVQNLMGNYEPFTIDRHNMRVMTGWTPEGKHPAGFTDAPPTQAYGLLEQIQHDYARRLGLDPAQTQAATWLGGETGVKSSLSQPFVGEFEEKLNLAAQKARLSPREMMRDFVLGNRPL